MPPFYEFKVRDSDGRKLQGVLQAKTEWDLIRDLHGKGYTVTAINEKRSEETFYTRKIPVQDLAVLCRQLSTTLRVGIPIVEGIETVAKESGNTRLKSILDQVTADLVAGMTLSQAFARHARFFPPLFIRMLQVAEASGNLEHVLHILSHTFREEYLIMKKVKGAFLYPLFVLGFALVIASIMMMYVLPVFLDMFDKTDAELPLITRVVLYLQQFVAENGIYVAATLLLALLTAARWLATDTGRRMRDYLLLHVPPVSRIIKKIETYRFSQTLKDLYASGISIEKSLQILSEVSGNTYFSDAVREAQGAVRKGGRMSDALSASPLFPGLLLSMVKVGEETGEMETLLQEVATYMEHDVDEELNQLVALIEPALMILVGAMVAALMASVIIPIYDSMIL
ncbi:MAG: type II secretion system F family protein [Bacillaceae bacterium]|nr:type II secretion system F family protein [Bacillaceae bacterium]